MLITIKGYKPDRQFEVVCDVLVTVLGAVDDSLEVREGPAYTAWPRAWARRAGRLDSHTPRTSLLWIISVAKETLGLTWSSGKSTNPFMTQL